MRVRKSHKADRDLRLSRVLPRTMPLHCTKSRVTKTETPLRKKMNWNKTQFDRQMPMTIECARNVGEILKYLEPDDQMQLKYSFYM